VDDVIYYCEKPYVGSLVVESTMVVPRSVLVSPPRRLRRFRLLISVRLRPVTATRKVVTRVEKWRETPLANLFRGVASEVDDQFAHFCGVTQ
jgi:hypothetical protein